MKPQSVYYNGRHLRDPFTDLWGWKAELAYWLTLRKVWRPRPSPLSNAADLFKQFLPGLQSDNWCIIVNRQIVTVALTLAHTKEMGS